MLTKEKIEKLREQKNFSRRWFDVLRGGFAKALADYERDPEDIRALVILINTQLCPAIDAAEEAREAYWRAAKKPWAQTKKARTKRTGKAKL